jgi:HTH-type transcriptional regulator/antitoxin HigA
MAERGWSMDELSLVTGATRQNLSAIATGKRGVTPDMAVTLAAAFGNTPGDWLKWDAEHQLSLVEADAAAIRQRARLFSYGPVREMQKRGWIRTTNDAAELEADLKAFFGDGFSVAMLKGDLAKLTNAERVWCVRARNLASRLLDVATFDPSRLGRAERKLRQLAAYPQEILRLPEVLASFGIRFVVVEPLPGTKVDGAAFWIDGKPVIAVSVRWDRIDAFWLTVMHEFVHIKHGDALSVDVNLVHESEFGLAVAIGDDESERRATDEAIETLVPKAELQSFITRVSPLYATARIVQFGHRIEMHPGVIVGQLQHRGEVRYSAHRDLLVKVRHLVTETTLTDGWSRSFQPTVT